MVKTNSIESHGYRIGAVSKLSGIAPETLRMWERRYSIVAPRRSPSGDRIYSAGDVARLRIVKELLDYGDKISAIALLPLDELQARAEEMRSLPLRNVAVNADNAVKLVVVSGALAQQLNPHITANEGFSLEAQFAELRKFDPAKHDIVADIAIAEFPTFRASDVRLVIDWLTDTKIAHLVVVYRFTDNKTLQRLPRFKCSAFRAPIDPRALLAHCKVLAHGTLPKPRKSSGNQHGVKPLSPAQARRYDDRVLARLATQTPTVKCECPRHLAELVSCLSAFETFSLRCESENPRDAALHAYLYSAASHARLIVEDALDVVIEAENLVL